MPNISYDSKSDELVIRVPASADLRKNAPESKSGKTRVLDSTHGFTSLTTPHGNLSISLNVTVPK